MNKDCEIARDLMPLVIDEAASEGSKAYVEAHMKTCTECASVYAGMKDGMKQGESSAAFEHSVKRVHRRMARGKILAAIVAALVICLIFLGVDRMRHMTREINISDADGAELTYTDSGAILLHLPNAGDLPASIGWQIDGDASGCRRISLSVWRFDWLHGAPPSSFFELRTDNDGIYYNLSSEYAYDAETKTLYGIEWHTETDYSTEGSVERTIRELYPVSGKITYRDDLVLYEEGMELQPVSAIGQHLYDVFCAQWFDGGGTIDEMIRESTQTEAEAAE